jgi:oligoribonuclease NrnB/cAMP/cGMP phosphodiesterase (DHH superfamily)
MANERNGQSEKWTQKIMQEGVSLLLYHCPCADGGFSAYAGLNNCLNKKVYVIPHSTTTPLCIREVYDAWPKENTELYLVDYCGPSRGFLETCCQLFSRVYVYDHHKTAEDMLSSWEEKPANLVVHLDMNKSGCVLAWELFHGTDEPVPEIFRYVEDNDLWRHRLPQSKEFSAGLRSLNIAWDSTFTFTKVLPELTVQQCIEIGTIELKKTQENIARILEEETYVVELPERVVCADVDLETFQGVSELGHQLAKKNADGRYGAVCGVLSDGRWKVSLRCTDGGDTTTIAQRFGGGGHKGASGFTLPSEKAWSSLKQ